jgi:hypothetical protein
MAYVYRHIRLDKNEPFYIGIGSDDKGKYERAKSKKYRNNHWYNIIACTDYRIEIILDDLTWEGACEKEKEFIILYGRKDLKNGILCNMTGGGDGGFGVICSNETKVKISISNKGRKHTEESRKKMSDIQKSLYENGYINPNTGKKRNEEQNKRNSEAQKGKKMSDESRLKMSISRKGRAFSNNHKENMRKNNAKSKKIINTETTEIYASILECQRQTNYKKLCEKLNGKRKNNTPIMYLEDYNKLNNK